MALVVARSFGSEALGNYGYALALTSVLLIVPDFGLHLFAVRELSASPKRLAEVFWGVHWLKFGLAALVVDLSRCASVHGAFWIASGACFFTFWSSESCCRPFLRPRWLFSRPSSGCSTWPFSSASIRLLSWSGLESSLAIGGSPSRHGFGSRCRSVCGDLLGWIILREASPVAALHDVEVDRPGANRLPACFPIGLTAILLALNLRIDIFVLQPLRHQPSARTVQCGCLVRHRDVSRGFAADGRSVSQAFRVFWPGVLNRRGDYVLSLVKNALLITALGALLVWLSAPTLMPLFFGSEFRPQRTSFASWLPHFRWVS